MSTTVGTSGRRPTVAGTPRLSLLLPLLLHTAQAAANSAELASTMLAPPVSLALPDALASPSLAPTYLPPPGVRPAGPELGILDQPHEQLTFALPAQGPSESQQPGQVKARPETSSTTGLLSPPPTVPVPTGPSPQGPPPETTASPVCPPAYNEPSNSSVKLLPYNIPVPGTEELGDGCARNEVRLYDEAAPCQTVLSQGNCPAENWILLNPYTSLGKCEERPCPPGFALVESDGFCHDLLEPGICPEGRRLFITATGETVCACPDGWYPDICEVCRLLYSHEGCPPGRAHIFDQQNQLRCLPATCPADQPVPLPEDGGCTQFGESCDGGTGRVGLLTDQLRSTCLPEEAPAPPTPGPTRYMYRRPQHRRTGRQIFSRVPELVSCQPGARIDFNRKCRDAVIPSTSGVGGTASRKPVCPRNTRPGPDGKCKRTQGGLGK